MGDDHKESSLKRRDTRAAKDPEPTRASHGGKRNTKRWCNGKVGVEHVGKCLKYRDVKRSHPDHPSLFATWRLLVCSKCGKELDYYRGGPKSGRPDWVTM